MRWRAPIDLEPHGFTPLPKQQQTTRAALLLALGLSLAIAAAWSLLALGAISGAHALPSAGADAQPLIDATHLPPLLTAADDHLDALRYTIACTTLLAWSV